MTTAERIDRPDLRLIADMVPRGARILDLGCGDGALLAWLRDNRGVTGYGIEIDADNVTACIQRGVNVIQRDIDVDLSDFEADSFDMVVMAETLQAIRRPDRVLDEMLRIAPAGIVTFPNFAHWRCRLQLALRGRMPRIGHLPHPWFDTPNIRLCTFADFEALCAQRQIRVTARTVVDAHYRSAARIDARPNLFGNIAIYGLGREHST